MNRIKAKKIANEMIDIFSNKQYNGKDISNVLDENIKQTTFYDENYNFDLSNINKSKETKISVVDGTTIDASSNFDGCILNFANAVTPGGSFLQGSLAQEESLCRCSTLYHSLINCKDYYEKHRKSEYADYFYTNSLIYSKDILIFRDDEGNYIEPYTRSFITSAAPMRTNILNSDPYTDYEDKIEETINSRIEAILKCAAVNGHRKLLLGAWGCGAFGNDPYAVAETFKSNLDKFNYFDEVVFSIYEGKKYHEKFSIRNYGHIENVSDVVLTDGTNSPIDPYSNLSVFKEVFEK